ncbi:protein of unknown function [Shewanella benthica]|uniref:Uncharacterized protein n=1 Tax=Shewanella benthica TaxID=43661 RepID=A0A330LV23_9GAMM|nr:hypothetical protein [Shewanella benthica]SQH74026.1 protein of unknown function [Shewanella benthica]
MTRKDFLGYGDSSNIKLSFNRPQSYFGGLGQLTERVDVIDMHVSEPQVLADYIQQYSDNIFAKYGRMSQMQESELACKSMTQCVFTGFSLLCHIAIYSYSLMFSS